MAKPIQRSPTFAPLWPLIAASAMILHAIASSATLTPQQFRDFRGQVTEPGQYTGSLEAQEYRFSGQLGGCGLVFTVVLRDWAYAPEALTYAVGSVSYFAKPGQARYIATKLVLDDIRETNGEVEMSPARANYSYLSTDSMSLAGKESEVIFDENGHALLGAYPDPDGSLMGFFASPSVTFSYNRGGPDVSFVLNTVGPPVGKEFSGCMLQLIQQTLDQSE